MTINNKPKKEKEIENPTKMKSELVTKNNK